MEFKCQIINVESDKKSVRNSDASIFQFAFFKITCGEYYCVLTLFKFHRKYIHLVAGNLGL